MFNSILVAVDQSEASTAAFQLALRLAHSDGDKLILLSVLDVSKLIAVAGYEAPYPIDAITMLKESTEQLLTDSKAACDKAGIPAETVMCEGDAADEILRVAEENKVGLICLGTHGRKGLSRLFLGSVAEGVLRKSTIPVLAIRPTATAETAAGTARSATAQAAS